MKIMMLKWNLWDVIGYVCLGMSTATLLWERSDQQYSLEKEDYYKIISSIPWNIRYGVNSNI